MSICAIHQDQLDSFCPCSKNYTIGLELKPTLDSLSLTSLDFYNILVKYGYITESAHLIQLFSEYQYHIEFNESYPQLGLIINSQNINIRDVLCRYKEDNKNHKEITQQIDNFEEGKEYLAYGTSIGDGHLSDLDFDTWRRVQFKNGKFKVIELEDSSRGFFKVKKVFKLPEILDDSN